MGRSYFQSLSPSFPLHLRLHLPSPRHLYFSFHSVLEIPIMPPRVIVVGAGLSGLSAAHTIYLAGGNVVLLDKNNFMGGNSTKATSGINGALTRTQVDEKIADSVKQFYDDTLKSAREKARPDLIKVLTYKSAAAVEWLQDVFNLDLTLVSRLGGHSFPRTHRGHDAKFPGMAITYALMQRFEELSESEPERVQLIKKAKVERINKEGNKINGVTYSFNGEETTLEGPVVLATGGYAADFSETSLLKKWRPDTFDLSTTNGAHATGDGHKMLMNIGANGIDMESVQVHPTGLVDPKDPTAKTKFLAAEALRGEGGLLLNSKGQRFTDELEHRDYVSGKMWEEKKKDLWPIRLVLNSKASNVLDFHTRHYSGRGLMKKMTGKELAKDIGCSEQELSKTFEDYNRYAKGEAKDPFGKKYYHNFPVEINDTFHVALMEPVLHFTMGGIEIDDQARCLNGDSKEPFDGLFVCGELAGGVHGATVSVAHHYWAVSSTAVWPATAQASTSSSKSSTAACRPLHPVSARSACTLIRTSRARSQWNGRTVWARTTSPPSPSNRRTPPHRSCPPRLTARTPLRSRRRTRSRSSRSPTRSTRSRRSPSTTRKRTSGSQSRVSS